MWGFGYILKLELTGSVDVWVWDVRKEGVKEGVMIIFKEQESPRYH